MPRMKTPGSSAASSTPTSTVIRDLTRVECEELLQRNHVGRIAFAFRGKVDIEPIHFVFADQAIYVRTTHGTKLSVLAHHPWVAFEVDEIDGPFDWKSVVVKGTVYPVEKADIPQLAKSYEHARDVLQAVMPAAFTADDPAPQRSIILRIHIHEWEGRASNAVPDHLPPSGT